MTFSKPLVPVSDLAYDMRLGPQSAETLDARAAYLASLGFERMQIVTPLPGYPQLRLIPFGLDANGGRHQKASLQSIISLQAPAREAAAAAHRHGLEAVAVYKPYEWGGFWSLPEGSPLLEGSNTFPVPYGRLQGIQPFASRHPEYAVAHRPLKAEEQGVSCQQVHRVEAIFSMDEVIIDHKIFGQVYPRQISAGEPFADSPGPTLWWSANNDTFHPVPNAPAPVITAEPKEFIDTAGLVFKNRKRQARVISWEGLRLPGEARFLAIHLPGDERKHVTLPFTMIRAYRADGSLIPGMSTHRMRNAAECQPTGPTLCENGFEFEPIQNYFVEPGWRTGNTFAWAPGHMPTLKANLCEGEPAVRDYWLGEIDRLIEAGYDGVDLRLVCHSAAVSNYLDYGYNEPIIRAYRDRHGVDISKEPVDFLKLMAIRGDFYLDFAEAARDRLHAKGRFLGMHAHRCYEEPRVIGGVNELCFWAAPKVLPNWERLVDLADEVSLKDYGFGDYEAGDAPQIRQAAHRAGKKVWRHCYHQQGNEFSGEFCRRAEEDDTLHGLLLYEIAHSPETDDPAASGLCGIDSKGDLHINPFFESRIRELTTRYAREG